MVVVLREQMRITDHVWKDFLWHLRRGQVKEEHVAMLKTLVLNDLDTSEAKKWDEAVLVTPQHAVWRLGRMES